MYPSLNDHSSGTKSDIIACQIISMSTTLATLRLTFYSRYRMYMSLRIKVSRILLLLIKNVRKKSERLLMIFLYSEGIDKFKSKIGTSTVICFYINVKIVEIMLN